MKQKSLTLGQSLGKYQALYNTFQVGTLTKWDFESGYFQVRLNTGEIIDSNNNPKYMEDKAESLYSVIGDVDPVGERVGVYVVRHKEKDALDVRAFLSIIAVWLIKR